MLHIFIAQGRTSHQFVIRIARQPGILLCEEVARLLNETGTLFKESIKKIKKNLHKIFLHKK